MAILTTIAGIPLFTTVHEALRWAAGNNCSGYHTHNHQGRQGFMGCTNHQGASGMPSNSNAPPVQQTQNTPQQRNTRVIRNTTPGKHTCDRNTPTTGSPGYSGGGGGSTGGGGGGSTGGGGSMGGGGGGGGGY